MKKILFSLILMISSVNVTMAQDPFIGEIRIFAGNFAPKGWAFCNGQTLPIAQNTALFSLLGTTYGGDGRTTFALPNLCGRVPIGEGQGPGLSLYTLGETGGSETVTLLPNEIPAHNHQMKVSAGKADMTAPSRGTTLAEGKQSATPIEMYKTNATTDKSINGVVPYGSNQPHNNMMPYITIKYIIALQGIYPPRS
jgi:microcystin-dependent protein